MRVRSLRTGSKVLGKDEVYVGRRCAGHDGSVLGNMFVIGREGTRDEVIAKYRAWLWTQVKNGNGEELRELGMLSESATLCCWCADLNERDTHEGKLVCHAQVIARCVRWLRGKVA